jgi:squalene monooxygenase
MSEPDRIVGELLQPGGLMALKALNLEKCVEGIDAVENIGYGVFNGDQFVKLAYPPIETEDPLQSIKIKSKGVSFHHGRFIMKLREACKSQSNITIVEAAVKELLTEDDQVVGVLCSKKDENQTSEQSYYAPLTFVADGCFSKFRKEVADRNVLVRSQFVG